MTCRRLILLSLLLVFLLVPSIGYCAADKGLTISKDKGPVEIEADHLTYEKEGEVYEGHGNVEVNQGDFSLKADHARLKNATKDLEAWGNVVLREGEDVLECQRLEVNLDSQMGKVYEAKLFLKDQNFHITGREAQKLGENLYRVQDGSLTTCDADRPPWKFTMKEMEVDLKGRGTAKGATAYLENMPFLYLPMAIFPVKEERQTGFLLPSGHLSSRIGPIVKNAFYWAIEKDMDATFYVDWLRDRGLKEGLEYRYAFTEETKGQANFYFIDDKVFDGSRYSVFVKHQQAFPNDFYLKADINYTSDNQYFRDFRDYDEDSHAVEERVDTWSLRQLRSVMFGGKNWDQSSLLVGVREFQDLTQESRGNTPQKLPEASFTILPQTLLQTPLFYDVTSSYSDFWQGQGVKSHREDFLPRISYPLRLFNVLKVQSDIAFRETLYQPYGDPTGKLEGFKSRELFDGGVQMSTEFYRVYSGAAIPAVSSFYKVDKWMHTIEPTVSYRYIPPVGQGDLPSFDDVDRIPFTSQITYGITQRLVGRPEKEGVDSGPYEYAKLKIFQAYSLGNPFVKGDQKSGRLSNIQAELWWNFKPNISARVDTQFDPATGNFDRFNFLVNATDKRNDAILIQYRDTRNTTTDLNFDPLGQLTLAKKVRTINFDARVKTIKDLYLYGGIRYNLLDSTRVDTIYGAEYQSQCWTVAFTLEDINRSPTGSLQRDLRYHLYFSLLGLGPSGKRSYLMKM